MSNTIESQLTRFARSLNNISMAYELNLSLLICFPCCVVTGSMSDVKHVCVYLRAFMNIWNELDMYIFSILYVIN